MTGRAGEIIVFEGIDGAGKTTLAERVHRHLRERGARVSLLREPGGTPVGEAVRKVLLAADDYNGGIGAEAEFLLFATSRAELARLVIAPLAEQGIHVILDRSGVSSIAYQGYGHGLDVGLIERVNHVVMAGVVLSRIYLLDLPVSEALARIEGAGDRIEKNGVEFFERVRRGYLRQAEADPKRFRIIDGSAAPDEVFDNVIGDVASLMNLRDQSL